MLNNGPRWPVEKAATLDERWPIRDFAAMAPPGGVPTA